MSQRNAGCCSDCALRLAPVVLAPASQGRCWRAGFGPAALRPRVSSRGAASGLHLQELDRADGHGGCEPLGQLCGTYQDN